jgi:predicted 2-oxoglutarate/Fe(II)-dependent dioxygenase YbiX/peroxiredoxin
MKSRPTTRPPAAKQAKTKAGPRPKAAAPTDGAPSPDARPEARFRNLLPGDPAIYFRARAANNPTFNFDTVAGRYVLLAFIGSTHEEMGAKTLKALESLKDLFDAERIVAFAVSVDPRDEAENRIAVDPPRTNVFWDFDLKVSRAYGAAGADPAPDGNEPYRPMWLLLDPTLRPLGVYAAPADEAAVKRMRQRILALPEPELHGAMAVQAPVLFIPRVFEPELCQALIAHYRKTGGEESGFMRDIDGKTTLVLDPNHKRRRDASIDDPRLMNAARERVRRRIAPEIKKAYQFDVTRIERDIVACYTAEDSAHFRAHRDNTTKGTAHRRFAVSINLNDDFEGGTLSFPEYSNHQYRIPPGGAVVFSCNLLHKVVPVTRGERFAYLPFLYDDAAARIREANAAHLDEKVGTYKDVAPAKAAKNAAGKKPPEPAPSKIGPMAFEDDEPIM